MKKILLLLAAGALAFVLSARSQDAATEERLNKLTGQLEDLQTARVKLDKQMADLLKELSGLREQMAKPSGDFATQDQVKKLTEKLKEIDEKRIADNEKILREIEKLARAGVASGARKTPKPAEGAAPSDKGYEYVIKSGDTLSTIVQAYREQGIKVTVDQVLKANPDLKPNALKVGQQVFIPAPKS